MVIPLNIPKMDWRLSLILYAKGITIMSPNKNCWEILESEVENVIELNKDFNGEKFDKGFVRLSKDQQAILHARFAEETPLGTIASRHNTKTSKIKSLIEKAIGRLEMFGCLDVSGKVVPEDGGDNKSSDVDERVVSLSQPQIASVLERKQGLVNGVGIVPRIKKSNRKPISTLGLGFRINNALKVAGFEYIDEIINKDVADISIIKGLGDKSAAKIRDKLAEIK